MNSSRKTLLALLVSGLLSAGLLSACGTDSETASADQSPNQQAKSLLTTFWSQVTDAKTDELETTLDDSWQLARADGTHLDKGEYLREVANGQIDIVNFEFEKIDARRSQSAITVRYVTTADYTLEGKKYAGTPAPYLATFIFEGERWRMTSQANFNVPVD